MARKTRKSKTIIDDVQIIDLGDKGRAVGRTADGEIILVEQAVPGDRISAQVVHKRKGMRIAVPVEYHSYSRQRVQPFCQHFGVCGGCKWQNLAYDAQLRFKEKAVRDALQRIGGIPDPPVDEIRGAPEHRFYRNKLEFTFTDQRWLTREELDSGREFDRRGLGFHVTGLFARVVDIEKCHLQKAPSNAIRNSIRAYCKENGVEFQNIRDRSGHLRNLVVRTNPAGECMVILIFLRDDPDIRKSLFTHLIARHPQIVSAYYCINEKLNDAYFDLPFHHFYGARTLTQHIGHVKFRLGPKSFFQTNETQAKVLFDTVLEMADLSGDDTVLDLYCGIGSISLYVAAHARQVIGIEEVPAAVTDAWANALLNDLRNVTFHIGDVREVMSMEEIAGQHKPDIIITDPPRAGMHPSVVASILDLAPRQVVYVSCNPATQARDIALMSDRYRLERAQPVDMFPHTNHIENVALLARRD